MRIEQLSLPLKTQALVAGRVAMGLLQEAADQMGEGGLQAGLEDVLPAPAVSREEQGAVSDERLPSNVELPAPESERALVR